MKCHFCERQFTYSFYIDDRYWIKVVGKENFCKNIGRICAHCTLEKLGGSQWYIVFNEPLANASNNTHVSDIAKICDTI